METQTLPPKPTKDYHSNVDTSRPFRSVKEAVAVFGERLLVGEIYSPKPYYTAYTPPHQEGTPWKFSPSPRNPKEEDDEQQNEFLYTLKKLQDELEETKEELKLLKERESETEIAVASLNAELHRNMSKLAEAEAAAAKKSTATRSEMDFERTDRGGGDVVSEEERRRELIKRMENSPTLAQILSLGEENGYFGGIKERKMIKKKPIIPLVGDFFFKKKGSSTRLQNPLYAPPQVYFNS